MNSVNLVGRITKDPEVRLAGNTNVVGFTIAISRPYKGQDGNSITDFISCVAWGNQVNYIGQYVKKGDLLSISGSIQTRKYKDQKNEDRVATEVIVERVSNLTPKQQSQTVSNTSQTTQYQQPSNVPISDEDLPF